MLYYLVHVYCIHGINFCFDTMCVTLLAFCAYDPVHGLYEHWPHLLTDNLQFHHKFTRHQYY